MAIHERKQYKNDDEIFNHSIGSMEEPENDEYVMWCTCGWSSGDTMSNAFEINKLASKHLKETLSKPIKS